MCGFQRDLNASTRFRSCWSAWCPCEHPTAKNRFQLRVMFAMRYLRRLRIVSMILRAVKTPANKQPATRIHCSTSLSDNANALMLARLTVARSSRWRWLDMCKESCAWSWYLRKSSGGVINSRIGHDFI